MPSPRLAVHSLRATLVTAGLALGCLGGAAAGASVALDATSATPSAGRLAPLPTLRVAADRAVTSTIAPRAAATTASRSEARVPLRSGAAHAARHRARPRHHGARRHAGPHHDHAAHRRHHARHHRGVVRRHGAGHRHHDGVRRHHAVRRHHHFTLRRNGHRHLTRTQKINRVIAVARAQRGKPYVWGAAGPHAFDCSGYVQWVYRRALGVNLPKYTDTQYAHTRHLHSAGKLRRGDLVFVRLGRHEEHVGIYAGHWRWWVAPHTGSHVKLQRIYPARHVFSRVIP